MIRKRNEGTGAALGGLAAAFVLLMGLPGARADELADLRANQELLQRRVEQLALGAPEPVRPGSPSLAGSYPRSFLIPGNAASAGATSGISCARASPAKREKRSRSRSLGLPASTTRP